MLFSNYAERYWLVLDYGYVAIVVPDGILTNSSSQYVRDGIEEKFRIVGVVSLPQTAFTNTGAGVKSSVLFLKKHDPAITEKIRDIKRGLQDDLTRRKHLLETAGTWEKEKQARLKPLKAKDEATKAQRQAQCLKRRVGRKLPNRKTSQIAGLPNFYCDRVKYWL